MSKWEQYKIEENKQPVANKWAKYRVSPIMQEKILEPEGDSWPALIGKSALKGATSIADLPRLAEEITAYPVNKLAEFFNVPGRYKPSFPTTADARAKIKEYTGVDLEPNPTTEAQRIVSNASEFAGGLGSFGFVSKGGNLALKGLNAAKQAGVGAGIGASSGIMQEMGVNPLLADIGASITPYGIKKLSGKLIPSAEESASRILKDRIGEHNLPKVIKNLDDKLPFPATTAELAQNTGISALHRAMGSNIPAIIEKQAAADTLLNKKINKLSSSIGLDLSASGNIIRDVLDKNLQNAKVIRATNAEPLIKKIEASKQPIDLQNTKRFLKEKEEFAAGLVKDELNYVKSLLKTKPISQKNKPIIKDIDKQIIEYRTSPAIVAALKAEKDKLKPKLLPGNVKGIERAINAKLEKPDDFSMLDQAKKNIALDLEVSGVPEVAKFNKVYYRDSQPVSAIEREPLLSQFVKKKKKLDPKAISEFVLSPEEIPPRIVGGSIDNTKALMEHAASNPKMLDTIRGSFINAMFNKASVASHNAGGMHNLSYYRFNNFLTHNKEKLKLVFDKNQMQVLNDFRELLRRRNMVETVGRAAGSNTQSETTLLAQLTSPLGKIGQTTVKFIPGGKKTGQIARPVFEALQSTQKQAMQDILADALLDPKKAKLLLTPTKDIKSVDQLNTILARLAPISNTSVEELQKQYPNAITIDRMGGQ